MSTTALAVDPAVAAHDRVLRRYEDYLDWLEAQLDAMAARTEVLARGGGPVGPRDAAGTAAARRPDGAEPPGNADLPPEAPPPRRFATGERFALFDGAPEMVVMPPGRFEMGAHPTDPDAQVSERPRRLITLARPLAISLRPVTFAQWDACRADDGTRHQPHDAGWGRDVRPVINVSWHDAEEYAGWLSRRSGERLRLPSESEWEYGFWAGQPQVERFPWACDLGFRQLRHHAWYRDNAGNRTQPVGQLQANAWGLQDLLGNVGEWVFDAWHADLSALPADGRPHASLLAGASRVFKGGSWLDMPRCLRPSARDRFQPDHRSYRVGFRVVMELPPGRWAEDA